MATAAFACLDGRVGTSGCSPFPYPHDWKRV
jgi:hypothetical protein